MELRDFLRLLKSKKKTVFWSVLVFLMLGALLTLVQPLEYGAKSRLLIVQETASVVDPYSMAKSNEHLGNILTNVIASNSFFNETLDAGYNINKEYFSLDVKKQMKRWHKVVKAKSLGDVGIIEIEVFHRDKEQAEQISQAINYTLKSKSGLYLNTGEKLTIKIIDQPIISTWPVRPNIFLNLFLALALGFAYGLSYVYLFFSIPGGETESGAMPAPKENIAGRPVAVNPAVEPARIDAATAQETAEPSLSVNLSAVQESAEDGDGMAAEPAPLSHDSEGEIAFGDILNQGDIRNILPDSR